MQPPLRYLNSNGAHDVTLENMALIGGGIGINILANTGSADVSLQGLDISGFSSMGVDVGAGATNFAITGSNIHDPLTARNYDGIDINSSVNAIISNDTFANVRYGVNVTGPIGLTINNNIFTTNYDGVNINIDSSTITGLTVDNNTVTSPTFAGLYIDLPYNGQGLVFIEGNTITGSPGDGIFEFGSATISSNTVKNNSIGIETSSGNTSGVSTVTGNTVTGNTSYGIEIETYGGLVSGNTISSNAVGVYLSASSGVIANNLLLNNTIAVDNAAGATASIYNDTVVQNGGIAIQNLASATPITIENSIFKMTGGTVFNVPAADQGMISSDYNMFDLLSGATMATWAGLTVPDFDSWMFGTGLDVHSLSGDPQFSNPSTGDYYLAPTSPGIDAGDPASIYGREPGNNGGRINLGMEGDTPNATQSAALTVQVTSPAGLAKLQTGVPTTINYRTAGVSGLEIVAQENLGGPAITSANVEGDFVSVTTRNFATATSAAIDMSGVSGPAPAQVYQSALVTNNGVGQKLVQSVAVADGTYQVTLNFAEYYSVGVGGRVFNITINGVTVATNFDIYKTAGNQINKAVNETFTVTASGGSGIVVELDNLTYNSPIISGIEVDKVTAPAASQTATVQVSPDGGTTWETVSTAPVDAYGNGSVSWTPNFTTTGNTAQVRVTVNGVTGVSQGFVVANAGNDYYIDSSTSSGGQYTTAPGSDLNSGKTPGAPMADLAALLRSYTLAPGDVVFIDSGTYQMLTDANLGPANSGVTFQGPTTGVATLNRENFNGNVFQLTGAANVTIADLTLTGAGTGILVNPHSNNVTISNVILENNQNIGIYVFGDSNNFTLEGSQIFGSANGFHNIGVYLNGVSDTQDTATITNNQIFGQYQAIEDSLDGGLIQGNSIHDNTFEGIFVQDYNGASYPTLTVTGNNVFNNVNSGGYGIYAYGANVVVTDNAIYGQTASGDIGLFLQYFAVATANTIYDNYDGVFLGDGSVTLTGNRIFVNTDAGVVISSSGGTVENNDIYSNGTGIIASNVSPGTYFNIQNNLIYANTTQALNLSGGGGGPGNSIIGNTIWQSVGTSIGLAGSAINTTIADNIVWGDEGTLISIASNSTTGLQVLYNLYYRGSNGAATLASIGGTNYTTLAAWLAGQPTLNAGSLEGNPNFIKPAGADGILGGPDTPLGGGLDDDFTLGKGSPAIDASDAYLQLQTDMLGQARRDDPATPNTGIGQPVYVASSTGTTDTLPTGTALSGGNNYAGSYVAYTLASNFTFYGVSYSTIYISPTGAIFFSAAAAANYSLVGSPSVANLQTTPMLAPFWGAIDTRYSSDGIFVDASVANYVTIRFAATPVSGTYLTPAANFAVRLGLTDGSILFEYGANLDGITPVIGVSAGTRGFYTVAPNSGQNNLSISNSISLVPNAALGLPYYDIGAIEFQGSSSNTTPPEIIGTVNLPANGSTTDAVFSSITLDFSETLDAISATSVANYKLIAAGPDGVFGTADDVSYALTPVYSAASESVTLNLNGGPLPNGYYQLTVSPSNGLLDSSGNALDGDGNTTPGGAFVSTFTIDRSADLPPVVTNSTLTTPGNVPLAVTLQATDPENNPISFAIVTAPQHGAIQSFNATTGSFTYLPDNGYVGADTITYSATDTKLAQSEATLTINITAVAQPPVASTETANAIAGQPVSITLSGYDLQTPANQLVLAIASQPTHGTVTVTGQNTVSYVASNGFNGTDAFTYTWTDAANLTSTPATVSIAVITINHAPVTDPTTISLLENASYTFKTSDFPYSDPNNTPATALKAVIFATLPGAGTITDNGAAVMAGQAVAAIDIVQGKLVYTPAANGSGTPYATFSFAVQNSGGTANGGLDTSASATATINVTAVLDASNTVPTTPVSATEGVGTAISGIAISDPDASGNVTTTLSVLNGALTVANNVVGGLTSAGIGGNGSGSVTLTGTVAQINATLAASNGLTYLEQGDHTTDTLTVATQDQGTSPLLTATNTVAINVTAALDASNTVPTAPVSATEGVGTAISGIAISDPDASGNVTTTLSVLNGALTVANNVVGGLSSAGIGGNGSGSVTLTGTVAQINA